MTLSRKDRDFRMRRVTHLEFKQIQMDRVLTNFLARLEHGGYPSRLRRQNTIPVSAYVEVFTQTPAHFEGFSEHRETVKSWVETHLMDLVNRGRPQEALAAPRPLHGYTYRLRNTKHCRDYGASEHLYELLAHARLGADALERLKQFFLYGIDRNTRKTDQSVSVDVETQALLHLANRKIEDQPDRSKPRHEFRLLCGEQGDLLAEDILKLLVYQNFIPRSVMVEYLKVLMAFHLSLHHLHLLRCLPALVRSKGSPTREDTTVRWFVDVAEQPDEPTARLAEQSAMSYFRRIPGFVRATYATKKLEEFAESRVKVGELSPPEGAHKSFSVEDVLRLLEPPWNDRRETYFSGRLDKLLEDSGGTPKEVDPVLEPILAMHMSRFDTFVEAVVALRGTYHVKQITETLDSLCLKNQSGAFLTQGRIKKAPRKFILDSRLIEVLLQLAVLTEATDRAGFVTRAIRVDELLDGLYERYGICVDRLPSEDSPVSMDDRSALSANLEAFKRRLREIGFLRDLSDAYVTQTVTPRYTIEAAS